VNHPFKLRLLLS